MVNLLVFLTLNIFALLLLDLVHDMEAMNGLC